MWFLTSCLLAAIFFACHILYCRYIQTSSAKSVTRNSSFKSSETIKRNEDDPSVFEARNIEPLPDFDLSSAEVPKLRPFKEKYHLTMGLTNLPISDYIPINKTLPQRLTLRRDILANHPSHTLQCSPYAIPAVNELYTYLTTTYLPRRYPSLYTLTPTSLITNIPSQPSSLPLTPPTNPFEALRLLGENIDQDFLILIKDSTEEVYRLRAFVTCFPSGFDSAKKFGLTLREVHGPVPRYGEKLERSMDRFFERLEVGRVVGRVNWAITTTSALYTPSGTHLHEGESVNKSEYDFNMEDVHLRVEAQTLHRLPQTKALVFSFKTYLYPLSEIKEEEGGRVAEELAIAVEGLKNGSVPEMWTYKRGVVWGERVCEYLRS